MSPTPNASIPTTLPAGPGRPRSFDTGYVIDAGVALFRRKGFEATSVEDLTEAMGISRSSFYAAFDSKHGVLVAALQRYSAQRLQVLEEQSGRPDGVESVLAALAGVESDGHGCLLVNCVAELCPGNREIAMLAGRHLRRIEALLADGLAPADRLSAGPLVAFALGAQTLLKSGADAEAVRAMLRYTRSRLAGSS